MTCYIKAVVAKQGPLVGLTPIEFDFMRKYGAVVIAVITDPQWESNVFYLVNSKES